MDYSIDYRYRNNSTPEWQQRPRLCIASRGKNAQFRSDILYVFLSYVVYTSWNLLDAYTPSAQKDNKHCIFPVTID